MSACRREGGAGIRQMRPLRPTTAVLLDRVPFLREQSAGRMNAIPETAPSLYGFPAFSSGTTARWVRSSGGVGPLCRSALLVPGQRFPAMAGHRARAASSGRRGQRRGPASPRADGARRSQGRTSRRPEGGPQPAALAPAWPLVVTIRPAVSGVPPHGVMRRLAPGGR